MQNNAKGVKKMWSVKHKLNECQDCGSSDKPHKSRGMCNACYTKNHRQSKLGKKGWSKSLYIATVKRRLRSLESEGLWYRKAKNNELKKFRSQKTDQIIEIPILRDGEEGEEIMLDVIRTII